MSWSFPIARFFGTQVRVHLTFFLLLAWIGVAAYSEGGWQGAFVGIAFILALFACVVLHEFGHALMARAFGIPTPDITLLPIGGVARLQRMPREPAKELLVALAGPAVNVVIAGILFLSLQVSTPLPQIQLDPKTVTGFFASLMAVNVWLVIFNMIPAFPMDGGRVFRAILGMGMSYSRATSVAAVLGQALAFVGGFLGFILPSPLLILIAFFIFLGAGAEASMVRMQEATREASLEDATITRFHSLREDQRIGDAIDLLLEGAQTDFPITDADGILRGVVMRNRLMSALREHGEEAPISKAATDQCETVQEGSDLSEAVQTLRGSSCSILPVVSREDGKVTGILSMENVGELLMVQSALAERKDMTVSHQPGNAGEVGRKLAEESST